MQLNAVREVYHLDNIQKIAEALEIETYLLFIDDGDKKDGKKAGGK